MHMPPNRSLPRILTAAALAALHSAEEEMDAKRRGGNGVGSYNASWVK